MQVTVDINDQLLREASAYADAVGLTLNALVEESLGDFLKQLEGDRETDNFTLRVFRGDLSSGGLVAPYDRRGIQQAIADSQRYSDERRMCPTWP